MLSIFASWPAAPGLIPSFPWYFLGKVNQWRCLEESGQWLENIDWTHLKLVLQKSLELHLAKSHPVYLICLAISVSAKNLKQVPFDLNSIISNAHIQVKSYLQILTTWFWTLGQDSSVGKASWIKVTQKRCNWTDVILIPGCGKGGKKKILATPSMRQT